MGSSGWFDVENGPGGSAGLQDYYHQESSRSVSSYDIPHFLSMSGVWDLPIGRGKRYLSHGIGSQVLGNWQLNGIVQLRSGQNSLTRLTFKTTVRPATLRSALLERGRLPPTSFLRGSSNLGCTWASEVDSLSSNFE